jgi:hypothetical protein
VLKPRDAQCAAAMQCPLANALTYEDGIAASQAGKRHGSQRAAAVRQQALAYRAADERNHAAAQALEVFYLLAEAEANREILGRSKKQIDAMLAEIQDLESRGVRVDKGAAEFRLQQLELLDRQAELQLSLAQANSRLRQLMGISFDEPTPIWPEADWKVTVPAIDANAAVRDGLYRRADINLLRMLEQNLAADTSEAVSSILSLITGTTGGSRAADCLLRIRSSDEIDSRRRQLDDYLARQELAAGEEIRTAVFTLDIRLGQIAVAKRKADFFRDQVQVQRLLRQRPGSTVTTLDIAAADLKLLDAQRELVHQVMALRIAEAKLKEAQGVLVFECCPGR